MKKTFKFLAANKQIISYLLSYLIILCISSFHFVTTILINLVLIINFVKLVLNANSNNNENKKLNYFLYSLLIGNYLIFQTMVYSYKEILGWELAIVILFNILFIYYLYCLKMTAINKKNIISINQNNKFFQLNNLSPKSQISSSHDKIFSCKL
jgi:hypothetical protein